MTDDLSADIAEFLETRLRTGFCDLDDALIDEAIDSFGDEGIDLDADQLAALVTTLAAEIRVRLVAEQATWPRTTDCDRLDAVFTALAASGFAAEQNFTCCQTCGFAEIGDVVTDPAATTAFVFFHQQDTEHAVEGGGMYMSFGAFKGGEPASIAAGHRIVKALTAHGLTATWDGTLAQRIYVTLDWKRRSGSDGSPVSN